MKAIAVVTTVATLDEARAMALSLVEQGLAACAQISEIESFYRWQGVLEHESEFRILFKTLEARYAQLEAAIQAQHSYALPAIHAFALEHVSAAYGEWIESQCREKKQ